MLTLRFINRVKRWKSWRQYTYMNTFEQILVLLRLKPCTWFESYCNWDYNENVKKKLKKEKKHD